MIKTDRVKIGLFLGVSPEMGGAYQYSLSLLKAFLSLPEDKYEVTVAYTNKSWEKFFGEKVNTLFLPRIKLTYLFGILVTLLPFLILLWRRVAVFIDPNAKRMKDENCDLWIFSSYSFLSYQMPVSSVGIVHDLMHRYEPFPETSSLLTFYWREKVFKNMCKHCKVIFVDSEIGKKQLIECYKSDENKVYPLPFIPAEYIYSKELPKDFDNKFKLPKKYLFYPAQFWEHKNHLRLLEAVADVKKSNSDISLVLVGSKKNAYHNILKKINLLGLDDNVIFLGFVPDEYMSELYRRARAMIYPTFFGPTNIPPLEALVTSCPMAISNIYGMPEQTKDAALYFDPRSVTQIADCVRRLWSDDALCHELKNRAEPMAKNYSQESLNNRLSWIISAITC